MIVLKAHYDGHAIVPDDPLDLPAGCVLEVQIRQIEPVKTEEEAYPMVTRLLLALGDLPPGDASEEDEAEPGGQR